MDQNTIRNIDGNVVRIGNQQDKNFEDLHSKIERLENNQNSINQNLSLLNDKLDKILDLLNK